MTQQKLKQAMFMLWSETGVELTQKKLAQILSYDQSNLSKIMRGQRALPKYLETSLEYFCRLEPEERKLILFEKNIK